MLLESVIENLGYGSLYIVFCFIIIFNDMNVYRLVVVRIKFENKSEYNEYRGNISFKL